jgi:hypothetical protein
MQGMEHRIHTIFEVVEQAARRLTNGTKVQPQAGARKLKATRKASARTSRRPPASKSRRSAKRKLRPP